LFFFSKFIDINKCLFFIASAVGSKTYILRSSLDPILIEHVAQTEADVFEEESGDQSILFPSLFNADEADYFEDDDEDDAERVPKYYGSLISWTKGDQLGAVGVLYVILALVLVNGRIMTDGEWWFLKRKRISFLL
jgi:melanoma-associated antigen